MKNAAKTQKNNGVRVLQIINIFERFTEVF